MTQMTQTCDFSEISPGLWRCAACGFEWSTPANRRCGKQIRGVGDVIAKLTAAIGIEPCDGCKERQAKWNRMLPL